MDKFLLGGQAYKLRIKALAAFLVVSLSLIMFFEISDVFYRVIDTLPQCLTEISYLNATCSA